MDEGFFDRCSMEPALALPEALYKKFVHSDDLVRFDGLEVVEVEHHLRLLRMAAYIEYHIHD